MNPDEQNSNKSDSHFINVPPHTQRNKRRFVSISSILAIILILFLLGLALFWLSDDDVGTDTNNGSAQPGSTQQKEL